MRDAKKSGATIADVVRKHTHGKSSPVDILDTPDKIRDYVERMKAATEEQLRKDQHARRDSEARARTRPID